MNLDTFTLEELQALLAKVATEMPPQISLIQDITAQIARLDPDNVRFTIDAGIINRLGQELVGKQETAVAELVKNSYDADATEVKLTFSNTDLPGGTLLIEDDGRGMTRDELLDGFMRLSSATKQIHPISTYYKRRRAGRKGIGRFAVQRLGAELCLTTQTEEAFNSLQITIKWDDFRAGVDLGRIASRVEVIPKEKPFGTTLYIKNLREPWSEAEQKRVYRYISEILQPAPLTKFKEQLAIHKKSGADPGFKVTLVQQLVYGEEVIASQEETIFSHALAVIEGHVSELGEGTWSVESKLLNIVEETNAIGIDRDNNIPYPVLRNVSFKAYYFIYLPDLLPKSLFKSLRELGRSQGGIKVFLNGFRVAPYGDSDDDWAGLDYSEAKRAAIPPHGNQNFFGFVELNDPDIKLFREKASREGLDENQAFKELQDFSRRSIIAGIKRIAEAREKKQIASQRGWEQKRREQEPIATLQERIDQLTGIIEKAQQEAEIIIGEYDGKTPTESVSDGKVILNEVAIALQNLGQVAQDVKELQEEREAQLLEELGMLRVLASLGIVIGEFTHEIRQTLNVAQINADDLADTLPPDSLGLNNLQDLSINLQRLRSYANYFDHTVSNNASRELEAHDLRDVARDFVNAVERATKRLNIDISYEVNSYDLLTPNMHASELNSLLFNFYSNSLKAIRRKHIAGKMLIRVGAENSSTYLEFADNGDGISPEIAPRIFNAFFTTSSPAGRNSTYSEEAQGSGLGLKIIHDIVTAYQGEVFLIKPPVGYVTCFRVEFPITSK